MRVAVITPYFKEDISVIQRCHNSVINQTHKDVTHIIISDGYPKDEIDSWKCTHIKIPPCGDYGDTPRGIGALIAHSLGFEGICFIDADCWCDPDHIEELISVQTKTAAQIITCPRNLFREDGTFLAVDVESDGINFNDTNCYLFTRSAFAYLQMWMMKDKKLSIMGDRVLWKYMSSSKVKIARSERESLNYTTTFSNHYIAHGEQPPKDSKITVSINGEMKNISFSQYEEILKREKRYARALELSKQPVDINLPLKNVRIFQIFYDTSQISSLDKSFTPFDNTSNERPDLREWFCWNKIHNSSLVDGVEYWGAVSPKFKDKTKINGDAFLKFINDNPGHDVYHVCPTWLYLEADEFNVWVDGDKHHPGLSDIANNILQKLGYHQNVRDLKMPTYFFCNFFVANKKFWSKYMAFIQDIFHICERDAQLNEQVFGLGRSNYYQDPSTSMFSFLIERFTPTFIILNGFRDKSFTSTLNKE